MHFEDEVHLPVILVPDHPALLEFCLELLHRHLKGVPLLFLWRSSEKHRQLRRALRERRAILQLRGRGLARRESQHAERQNLACVEKHPFMLGIVMGVAAEKGVFPAFALDKQKRSRMKTIVSLSLLSLLSSL